METEPVLFGFTHLTPSVLVTTALASFVLALLLHASHGRLVRRI